MKKVLIKYPISYSLLMQHSMDELWISVFVLVIISVLRNSAFQPYTPRDGIMDHYEFLREAIQRCRDTYIMQNARFAAYYERRLIDAANGHLTQNNVAKRYQPAAKIIPVTDITKTDEFAFKVVSTSDRSVTYTLDMNLSVCTCHVGMTGAPCKHQLSPGYKTFHYIDSGHELECLYMSCRHDWCAM